MVYMYMCMHMRMYMCMHVCMYASTLLAACQVRCPCRHSDARNSPRVPAAPSQVLSTRIEPAYPLQLSASRLMLELIEQVT